MIRFTILALCLTLGTTLYSQNTNVLSNGGSTIDNGTLSLDQTIGELVVDDITGSSIALEQGFQNTHLKLGLLIAAKAFLQGPYNSANNLMNDDLRSLNFLPLNSPYLDAGKTTTQPVFDVTGNNAIVDWVFVEVRDRSANNVVIDYQSGLLQRDGDVVDVDGVSPLKFQLFPGTYFVSIKHRNHLGVITDNAELLTKVDDTFDFTTSAISTEGGSNARVILSSGDFALWAGDSGGDSNIKFSGAGNDSNIIKDFILSDPGNFFNFLTFSVPGYNNDDVNLDGVSKFSGADNDSNVIKDNVLAHPGNFFNFLTYTINSSIPND